MKKQWTPSERNKKTMEELDFDWQIEYDTDSEEWLCYVYSPIGKKFNSSGCHTDRAANNKELGNIIASAEPCTDPDCEYCVTAPGCPLYN